MITTAFVTSAYFVLGLFIGVFPQSGGFPPDVAEAFSFLGGYVGMLDPIIPVDVLGFCVGTIVSVQIAIYTFRIVEWTFSKIPLIGR